MRTTNPFDEPFKSKSPFSTRITGRVNKNLNLQQLKSTTAISMHPKSTGLRMAGETKGSINEVVAGIKNRMTDPNSRMMRKNSGITSNIRNNATRGLNMMGKGKVAAGLTSVALGMTAMAGIAFMNGAMNQANDIMMERYMKDGRYSNRMTSATNLGQASSNSPLSMSSHVGLSLAMSKVRHGF